MSLGWRQPVELTLGLWLGIILFADIFFNDMPITVISSVMVLWSLFILMFVSLAFLTCCDSTFVELLEPTPNWTVYSKRCACGLLCLLVMFWSYKGSNNSASRIPMLCAFCAGCYAVCTTFSLFVLFESEATGWSPFLVLFSWIELAFSLSDSVAGVSSSWEPSCMSLPETARCSSVSEQCKDWRALLISSGECMLSDDRLASI